MEKPQEEPMHRATCALVWACGESSRGEISRDEISRGPPLRTLLPVRHVVAAPGQVDCGGGSVLRAVTLVPVTRGPTGRNSDAGNGGAPERSREVPLVCDEVSTHFRGEAPQSRTPVLPPVILEARPETGFTFEVSPPLCTPVHVVEKLLGRVAVGTGCHQKWFPGVKQVILMPDVNLRKEIMAARKGTDVGVSVLIRGWDQVSIPPSSSARRVIVFILRDTMGTKVPPTRRWEVLARSPDSGSRVRDTAPSEAAPSPGRGPAVPPPAPRRAARGRE
ncbi:PREDICTED: uncharacterized protein LOC106724095 [Myotis brandtii]|uniref:uncharacterized protein LOC106724095 n=1 Tax=Myotis brandtii TaxID=109478 RepID=UPI0007046F19|nr:PREDICTED: uncharacterized protein LOC106724095 [Myotis brandtii]